MKKTVKKNVKTMSFHQLCEAIEAGDKTILEEFDFDTEAPAEDADFTAEFGGDEDADVDADVDADADADVEDDLEDETEGEDAPATVSIEIDPNGSLADALHAILDVLEGGGEEMVEDDMDDDAEAEGDDLVEDDTEAEGDDLVEDDTAVAGDSEDEDCEGLACEKKADEDEELAASAPASGIHVADKMKETKRTKNTPAVNRKGTADDDLELAPHTEGDAAGTKPTERKKQTPAIDRSATAKSRLTPTKRITNIGK